MVQPTRSFMPSSDAIGGAFYPPRSPSFPRLPSVALGQSSDASAPSWPITSSIAPGSDPIDIQHPSSPQIEHNVSDLDVGSPPRTTAEVAYVLALSILDSTPETTNICPYSYD